MNEILLTTLCTSHCFQSCCHIHIFLLLGVNFRKKCSFRGKSPTFIIRFFLLSKLPSFFLEMIPTYSYFFIKSHISNLLRPMEFFLKQVKSGYGPLYILRGQRLYFFKKRFISFSADLDEMSHHVAFHLGLNCLSSELPVLWFLVKKNYASFQIFSWYA